MGLPGSSTRTPQRVCYTPGYLKSLRASVSSKMHPELPPYAVFNFHRAFIRIARTQRPHFHETSVPCSSPFATRARLPVRGYFNPFLQSLAIQPQDGGNLIQRILLG